VFRQTRPKLAVFTHIVLLGSEKVPPSEIDEIVCETPQTYDGPLQVGEDFMEFEIGETITVRRLSPETESR
jgi:ribonuclease Z